MELRAWKKAVIHVSSRVAQNRMKILRNLHRLNENVPIPITIRINSVAQITNQLVDMGILERERVGRTWYYKINPEFENLITFVREDVTQRRSAAWNTDNSRIYNFLIENGLVQSRSRRRQRRSRRGNTNMNFPTHVLAVAYAAKRANKLQELQEKLTTSI